MLLREKKVQLSKDAVEVAVDQRSWVHQLARSNRPQSRGELLPMRMRNSARRRLISQTRVSTDTDK